MFYIKYIIGKYKCNKFKSILNILSVAIGLAIILAIQLSTTNNINGLKENSKYLNGGDISIAPYSTSITNEQMNVLKKSDIEYTTATWLKTTCQHSNKSVNLIMRFVDFSNYPYYGEENYSNVCEDSNDIILSKNLAQQLEIAVGDIVDIFNAKDGTKNQYTVKKIVELDSENDMDMNLFGYAFINNSETINYFDSSNVPINKIYIKTNKNESVYEDLVRVFSEDEIKTSEELYNETEIEVRSIMKGISIIGILATIMGGIGIASTIVLNVKKEQREICVLRTFGMKQKNLNFMVILESCITGILSFIISIPFGILFAYEINSILYEGMTFKFYSSYISDILFILLVSVGISVIFSFIPTKICSTLSPVMVLREEDMSKEKKLKIFKPILLICIFLTAGVTFYYNDLRMIVYIIVLLLLAGCVYLFLKLVLNLIILICKVPVLQQSLISFTVKRLKRSSKELCLIISTLLIGLLSIGLTQNISGSILPGVEALINDQLGYNVLLTSSKANETKINNELSNMDSIKSYIQTLRINTTIININNSPIQECINANNSSQEDAATTKKNIQNLTIEGLETTENRGINIVDGEGFTEKDNDANIMLMNKDIADSIGVKCGDKVQVNMENNSYIYKVIGLYEKQLVNTSEIKVPLNSLSSDVGWTSVTYYLDINSGEMDNVIDKLYEDVNDCFIVNMENMSPSLYKTVRKQINLFKSISVIAIVSFILFMTNIILIDMVSRKKELMLYKVLGAKKTNITLMIIIEAVIIGLIASILAYALCSVFTSLFLHVFLEISYVRETISFWILLVSGVSISLLAMLLVLPQISINKLNSLLREY